VGLAVLLLVASATFLLAGGQTGMTGMKMERYLIITSHTPEQCLKALDEFEAMSPMLLAKTDWGCMAGDHTGYTIVQAQSEDAARQMLPEDVRMQAKVIRLNKFTAEQIRQFHTKK
jgi:hypothetical protein